MYFARSILLTAVLLAGAFSVDAHAGMIGVGIATAAKPDCTPSARGRGEVPFSVATGDDPYPGFKPDSSMLEEAWEKAFTEALRVPPSKVFAPIKPAPRLLPMLIG